MSEFNLEFTENNTMDLELDTEVKNVDMEYGEVQVLNTGSLEGAVLYNQEQDLTEDQKAQARENIGAISEEDIPSIPSDLVTEGELEAKGYARSSEVPKKPSDIGAEASGTADSKVSTHDTNDTAHNDIRLLISGLTTRLNALANSSDTDLDQLAEIVAYIKSNRTLIEGVTTNKVNVSDIIDNLTTNVSNKPLSASQGVVLKGLIDAIKVPTKVSELTNDKNYLTAVPSEYAKKTDIPSVPTKTSQLTNDSGFLTNVPSEYVTETELTNKGYAKQSDVTNHTGDTTKHITSAERNKWNKNTSDIESMSLSLHNDGLLYLLVNGVVQGNGIAMTSGETGDVIGNLDSSNNIVLNGDLEDGTYTIKYETDDGKTINIGNLVLDSNVYYSITNKLTSCTSNNSTTSVIKDNSYTATITASSGYELKSITVTMGGANVTSTAVSGNKVSISKVTGNIVITAVAEAKVVEPITRNIALTDGIRTSTSDGGDRTQAGYCTTEYIDLTNIPKPCTIHLTKALWAYADTSQTGAVGYYAKKADGSKLLGGYTNDTVGSGYFTVVRNNGLVNDVTVTITSNEVASIRFSGYWANSYSDSDVSFASANTKATLTYTPN